MNTHSGKGKGTKRGVKPSPRRTTHKPGRNRPAVGYNQVTKTWER